ncbi:MAG: biotin--[acetyl-CoA-carboxylase] ligase [Ferrimicrobium sp.]
MLNTTRWRVILLDTVASTNRIVRECYAPVASRHLAVVALHQDEGRGRSGSQWFDLPGRSLLCSTLHRIDDLATVPALPFLAAVSMIEALGSCGVDGVELKWPNDLVYHGAKLGGILIEGSITGGSWIGAIGIGVNVGDLGGSAGSIDQPFTSVEMILATGPADLTDRLLGCYLDRLGAWESRIMAGETAVLFERYRSFCVTLGQWVSIETKEGSLRGVVEEIAVDGTLHLRESGGELRVFLAGSVLHLRHFPNSAVNK